MHIAPSFTALGEELGEAGRITLVRRTVESSDLDGVDMLLVTVDDLEEAGDIAKQARALRIPTNVADVPKQCDFWFPASFTEGPIQVAISTNGQSPAGASRLKRFFRMALPSSARDAIERLGQWRVEQRKIVNSAAVRMSRAARQARQSWKVMPTPLGESVRGRVTLVGAGPGDPDLLTIAAIDALSAADLVVADRLVPKAIMDLVSCELRIARKWRGRLMPPRTN